MITLTCDRPGHVGIFTCYRDNGSLLLAISRLDMMRINPNLPDDQMTVEVDFKWGE